MLAEIEEELSSSDPLRQGEIQNLGSQNQTESIGQQKVGALKRFLEFRVPRSNDKRMGIGEGYEERP